MYFADNSLLFPTVINFF